MPEKIGGELPPPSAELVLYRVAIEAFVQTVGRKKAERFLTTMADSLATEENFAHILKIRPPEDDSALDRARRQAMHWFRQMLPRFMARLK